MDYEKEYKEALGRARTFSQRWQGIEATDSELALQEVKEIFPELKESEDERIRKWIISDLKDSIDSCAYCERTKPQALEAIAWLEKQGGQKLAWSEENICYYDDICEILINLINSPKSNVNKDVVQKDLDWLRSVKESQLKPTWSEEDEMMFTLCASSVQTRYNDGLLTYDEYEQASLWLKSLKERMKGECISVTDEELAQAKKDAYNDALDKIEYHSGEPTFDDGWSAAMWYLKKKNTQPQNTWKPSDEQIEVLYKYAEQNNHDGSVLTSLYRDLKKLM